MSILYLKDVHGELGQDSILIPVTIFNDDRLYCNIMLLFSAAMQNILKPSIMK
jgi:hypothetical protein